MIVFVFASNLKGIHNTGAALRARRFHGAKMGVGSGMTGHSWALPLKADPNTCLPRRQIARNIADFLEEAEKHPRRRYIIARMQCKPAGITEHDIARMFAAHCTNCYFHPQWKKYGLPTWEPSVFRDKER